MSRTPGWIVMALLAATGGAAGPWETFHGEIVGYAHEPGVSNVLRINRFKRPQPPADASAYIYELDLVVESRVAEKT